MATTHNSTALTQTGQNPVSAATVKSIPLNANEKALVRKDEASKRKAYLKALEADARKIVSGCQEAREIGEQAKVLHRKFKDVVVEMRPVFERVREGFAHLRKGETVMGETTGDAWAQKHLCITYNWLCRCLNQPKAGRLLLTDGTRVLDVRPAKSGATEEKTRLGKAKQKEQTVSTTDKDTDSVQRTPADVVEDTVKFLDAALVGLTPADVAIVIGSLLANLQNKIQEGSL